MSSRIKARTSLYSVTRRKQKYERRRKSGPQKVQVEFSYISACVEKAPVEKSLVMGH